PGGLLDPETKKLLETRGMVCALWDVNINDTKEGKTKAQLLKHALDNVKPGSIILAHDGVQATVDMLPELITKLKAQGYEFVTLSQMCAGLE
ncbi:MAG: polysaccharide deacetylase family protein, partial [bacterium]|nr:polysaccharide deacetylase family protein [bacterium]